MKKRALFAVLPALLLATAAHAQLVVTMNQVDAKGIGKALGRVTISQTQYGVVFAPELSGVTPGLHGFHVHQNPDCGPKEQDGRMQPALAAGDHFDPSGSGRHGTPWGDGHLGDLPALYVDAKGNATQPVLAPRLKLEQLSGRSLMIHAGGDNHADHPQPSGGGGARIVCGVIR
ncbi:MAG: superoxide dismutase [Cu-Zn] SodC [Burkholderiaceae bacterium]